MLYLATVYQLGRYIIPNYCFLKMIKYAIIEDEDLASKELLRMLHQLRPDYVYAGRAESVVSAIPLLEENHFDLIFMDIDLGDGFCFEIFEQVEILTPIIFITAHNEFVMRAFDVNGLDYLLKPVEPDDLEAALTKFEKLQRVSNPVFNYRKLDDTIRQSRKNRFLIQRASSYSYVNIADIAFFYSEDKVTFLYLYSNKRHIISYSLDQLEDILDAKIFFRASRNCIVNVDAIKEVQKYFNSRLKLTLEPSFPEEMIVSRVSAKKFLQWLDS